MERTSSLVFLLENPTISFRVVHRKGALRYVASNRRGSLGAMTQFAPPTKRFPKLLMGMLGLLDFRIPGVSKSINISADFLKQAAVLLKISKDRVGIYVGEPNDQQKLVVTDVKGESEFVLKVAAGSKADQAIERERVALEKVSHEAHKGHEENDFVNSVFSVSDIPLGIPRMQRVQSVSRKSAILIECIEGRQLTPEEFERAFFGEESSFRDYILCFRDNSGDDSHKGTESSEYLTVGEWLHENGLFPEDKNSVSLVDSVSDALAGSKECDALKMRSPLGVVHGDFAPWNIIQRTEVGRQRVENPKAPSSQLPALSSLVAIDWEFSRPDTPLIFDYAYAAWCYSELLGRTVSSIDSNHWKKLVALGALWKELRQKL